MKGRSLALLLLLYLALDLGNPFMPGAVQFVDGRLAVVDAGRPPGNDAPLPAVVVGSASRWTGPVLAPTRPRLVAVGDHTKPWGVVRRTPPSATDPTPAADDH